MNKKIKNILIIFKSMFFISAFTFGGGFAIVSLMKDKFVDELHYIDDDEMLDIISISQSCPGPIAVNAALLVGYKIEGILGMIFATIATILPPIIIISVISIFYEKFSNNETVKVLLQGMQAAVSAIIINVAYNLGSNVLKNKNVIQLILLIASFIAVFIFKVNAVYIIIASILISIITINIKKEAINK